MHRNVLEYSVRVPAGELWTLGGRQNAMETLTEIYVELLDEGVEVFRPVQAAPLGNQLFRIASRKDDPGETWKFQTGAVVRCRPNLFADGTSALLAVELVESGF